MNKKILACTLTLAVIASSVLVYTAPFVTYCYFFRFR